MKKDTQESIQLLEEQMARGSGAASREALMTQLRLLERIARALEKQPAKKAPRKRAAKAKDVRHG